MSIFASTHRGLVSPSNQYFCILFAYFNVLLHNFSNLQKHMLPQHCKTYNDVFLLINSTKV
jgi:hypothetical protein